MPLYDYECPNCGVIQDVWAAIDEQEKTCFCGRISRRILSATRIQPDLAPYFDENLSPVGDHSGSYVKSRQHRRELMRRYGLQERG